MNIPMKPKVKNRFCIFQESGRMLKIGGFMWIDRGRIVYIIPKASAIINEEKETELIGRITLRSLNSKFLYKFRRSNAKVFTE